MDFDLNSKETRISALKSFGFWLVMMLVFIFIPMTRVQTIIVFSLLIIGLNIYKLYPNIYDFAFIKLNFKALVYLYLFVAVFWFIGGKLMVYGLVGYLAFILLYVAFILYQRWDLYISGIDQIIEGLKKIKK